MLGGMSRLPILPSEGSIRRSKSSRWRAAVLIGFHVLIAAHITHWLVTGQTVTPVEPSEAAAYSRTGMVNAGLIFFAVTIVLTAVFGRFFCGWACHLVALQDACRALLVRFGRRPKELRSRFLRWVPAIAFLYAFIWPLLLRLRRGGSLAPTGTEVVTSEFWATFPGWVVGGLTFVVCGGLVVYFLGSKGFCTYACPYGAAFAAAERLSPMRIRVTDACAGCGHCTAVCSSNVRVHEEVRDFGMVVDSGCMKCLDCVSVCPNDALYYGAGPIPLFSRRRASGSSMERFPLTWPEEVVLGVAFLLAFLTFRGLYGYVPFLFALGISGVFAYLSFLSWQLATRPHLAFKSWRLKRSGRVLPAGRWFAVAMVGVALFWIHSGVVRWSISRGDRATGVVAAYQAPVYNLTLAPATLPEASRRAIETGSEAYRRARTLGLVDTHGAAARLAQMEGLLGHSDAATALAQEAIERGELAGQMHQLLARMAFDRGNSAEAERQLGLAARADVYDPRPLSSLGIVRIQRGDLVGAEAAFRKVIEAFGETASRVYDLGLAEAYAGHAEEAIQGFERALVLDPKHLPARENLAGLLAVSGRYEESVSHYQLAISQSPSDATTRVLLGQVLIQLGRLEEAAEQAEAALRLEPGMPAAGALLRVAGQGV
jgi:polyferredoxin/Flp pilus assembly protein TadD